MTIMDRIANLLLPTEVILILMHVVVFSGDGLQLDNSTFIQDTQTHYLSMVYRFEKNSFYFLRHMVIIFHFNTSSSHRAGGGFHLPY